MILLEIKGASLLDKIIAFDKWLMLKINNDWTLSSLDTIFPVWRESLTWIPLYVFLLAFAIMNFGGKIWTWIFVLILTVICTDQISSGILKDWFERLRPCRDPDMMYQVRLLLNRCPISFSFTSSHATNHFGVAVFIITTMKPAMKQWRWFFLFWAATISYGQVYVGVHYPLDILGGACVGSLTGWIMAKLYQSKYGGLPELTQYN